MGPSSTCPSTPVGTPRNTLHTLLHPSASSSRKGLMHIAGSLDRLLWSWPGCSRISWRLLGPRTLSHRRMMWRPASWRSRRPRRCSRSPEAAQRSNCQDIGATEEPPVRWSAVQIGSRFLQDARAWLVGWSKRSGDRREASTHVGCFLILSLAA